MTKRRTAAFALPVAIALIVSACGNGATQSPGSSGTQAPESPGASGPAGSPAASAAALEATGALNVMGFGCREGDDIATTRIELFEEQYPDVELSCVEGGLDDQQFLTAVQSGNPPDLIYMDRSKIGTFAAQGAIQPVDECYSRAAIDTANIRQAALAQVTFDGQMYGIPEFFNTVVIVINNEIAEEAGIDPATLDMSDWDAITAANEAMLTTDGGDITRLGFDPKLPEFLPLWSKINGVDILSEDGTTSNLDDPKVAEALTFARDLIAAHGTAGDFFAAREALSPDFFGAGNPIAGGVLGAFPIEVFFLNVMAGNSPDVDITVLTPKTRDGQDVTFATGLTWAIPEGAANVDAACAMAAQMTSHDSWIASAENRAALRAEEGQPYTGTYTGYISADEQIFGEVVDLSAIPAFDEAVQTAIGAADAAFAIPPTGASVAFEAAWRDAVNRVLNEGADPAEALAEADQAAQSELDAGG
jgi:multiple sugar transport system substrate-binding protein